MAYTDIDKPEDYFNTVLYTGNGSTQSITGVGFQPDWVWIKDRTDGTSSHRLIDSVRGATKEIYSDLTNAENTDTNGLTSFNSDGFSVGTTNGYNKNTDTFVSWNWYTGATASSNTDGSITSSVSANTTAGFSIVSYTGTGANATVGHGLGSALDMVIVKNRDDVANWKVWHNYLSGTQVLELNNTDAVETPAVWNSTIPTSSVFSVGTQNTVNGSGDNIIAYCFAEKKGYSKFGIYNGVGSFPSDVTNFVYTGFKPAFIMLKQTAGEAWNIVDNKRAYEYNPTGYFLYANTSGAEAGSVTYSEMDLLSNGFCLRKAHGQYNETGKQYIYMAFAENPFVTSTGICCTAR